MDINYAVIGRRIRKLREERNLTQAQLAELADISVTHLSHIETANTKLSLPVFISIASNLHVKLDELVRESASTGSTYCDEMADMISGCYSGEQQILYSTIKTVKSALDTHVKEYRSFGYSDSQPASHIIE